ncbi:MAG: 2-C-methyl-D-erythritol 4-phosphate cytidylyltransferase [Lentisphaeria bacterium]|nr:2-C-methyl-D-erythritol 4-phosphate cytidylyltransferase [Lentisphaeria bacterium]
MSADRTHGDVGVVLAAAGAGTRFGGERSKLLLPLEDMPVFLHPLHALLTLVSAADTVVVVPAAQEGHFRRALADSASARDVRVVTGGSTRAESVLRGIHALPPPAAFVAVLDAARPLTAPDLIGRCIASARRHGSGVAAHRITDTIKTADAAGNVTATLDRNTLWATETPQVFRTADLAAAYERAARSRCACTDEAAAIEAMGLPVRLVESSLPNPKLTFAADVDLIRALLHTRNLANR